MLLKGPLEMAAQALYVQAVQTRFCLGVHQIVQNFHFPELSILHILPQLICRFY